LSVPLSIQPCNLHIVVVEPDLDVLAQHLLVDLVGGEIDAADREQLRLQAPAEDARARLAIGARQRAAAQRAVNVDGAAGDDVGAGSAPALP